MRPLVIHYHIYKNAGTSVDDILAHNFGHKWAKLESDDGRKMPRERVEQFILNNPQIQAISSHTAEISIPRLQNVDIIPIVFFRHPIDRIRSVFEFEKLGRGSAADANQVAAEGSFEDYFIWRLKSGAPWQVTNFQSFKLKDFFDTIAPLDVHLFRENARKVFKALPFVGLVEKFEASMARFKEQIDQYFPAFEITNVHLNDALERESELQARLQSFRNQIGFKIYRNLYQINGTDLELYYNLTDSWTH